MLNDDSNPFRPPDDTDDEAIVACSFCRSPAPLETLVQAPDERVFICGDCARRAWRVVADGQLEQSTAPSTGRLMFGVALVSAACCQQVWFRGSTDETSVVAVVAGLFGASVIGHFLLRRRRQAT